MFNLHRTFCRPGICRSLLFTAAGSLCAMLATMWVSLCGSSVLSMTALAVSVTAGVVCLEWVRPRVFTAYSAVAQAGDEVRVIRQPHRSLQVALFMTLLATIWLTPLLLNLTLLAGCETFGVSGTATNLLVLMFPGLIVILDLLVCGLFLQSCSMTFRTQIASDWISGTIGCLLMLLHGVFNMPMAVTVTILFFAAAVLYELVPNNLRCTAAVDTPQLPGLEGWTSLALLVSTAILVVSGMITLRGLVQWNLPLVFLAAFLTSLIVGILSHSRSIRILGPNAIRLFCFAAFAALPWVYSALVNLNLSINAGSGAIATMTLRALQIAIVCSMGILPFVISTKGLAANAGSHRALAVLTGIVVTFVTSVRGISPISLMSVGLLIHVAAIWLREWRAISATNTSSAAFKTEMLQRRMAVAAATALATLPIVLPMGDETRTASLLFSPRTVVAMQRGVEKDLIEHSDANRLVERVDSQSGNLSVWRRGGHVYEFQQNGIPLGRVSADTNITPQPPEEVLPAIMALVSHPQPGRILLMGDDTGVCLRTSTHFPLQEIVALRGSEVLTSLAKRYTWNEHGTSADEDPRVRLLYLPPMLALRDRSMKSFDVIVAAMPQLSGTSGSFQYTSEFYESVCDRLTSTGVFCQRLKQTDVGPGPIKQVMSGLMEQFQHVGVIQTIPGELVLLATNSDKGLVDPQILKRLQRDHVKQEIATTGWDWSQVAVLPLIDANDPIGLFSHEQRPRAISIHSGGFTLCQPMDSVRLASKSDELRVAFGPHQVQLASTVPLNDDVKEAQRRLTSLQQQLEILAGMPDQPWTYRKSLRMEMQRDPRPPIDVVRDGQIVKRAHPLDDLRKDYFVSLGDTLQLIAASAGATETSVRSEVVSSINSLGRFATACEPLLSHFAHYEIIRMHELAGLQSYGEQLKHRLHIVFFTTPTDASVRPVISALEQVVEHPELIPDDVERYDLLNSLVQKLIERWEARTAWEPKSALRVQNDVEKSVRVVNLAMDQMEKVASASVVSESEFLSRRRYVTAALISPLRDYRDQVLAHRMKTESTRDTEPEPNTEEASDLPLLITPEASASGINTN